ncbi:glycosyltransferase 87 family protein [Kitasatospora sp. NPDC057198]|uniref:glycosyltransferase 87 family protein n=1 Tax=Kitasatospora sp. NPDC057198 TaxID=3346046 RepID=UPI00363E01B7
MPGTIEKGRLDTGSGAADDAPATHPFHRDPQVLARLGYWACSRFVMVMMVFWNKDNVNGEPHLFYEPWARVLRTGTFPVGDVTWQYPPGAAGAFLAPYLVPFTNYVQGFLVLTLIADFAIMGGLLWYGTRAGRSLAGSGFWLLGLPLMLMQPYVHFDVLVTLFAVFGVLCLQGRSWVGGSFAAIGAMIKVWPAFAIFGAPRGRGLKQAITGFVAAALALTAIAAVTMRGSFDFLHGQGNRGIEVESLPGSLLLIAQKLGYHHGEITYRYGSMEIVSAHTPLLSKAMLGLSVLGFAGLLVWRIVAKRFTDSTPADAAMTAMLVFVVTSRVISPQYMIWLLGMAAVCLSFRSTSQRPVAVLLMAATALTTVEYPLFWGPVLWGDTTFRTVLLLRNALLVAAVLLSCARLWRSTVPSRRERRQAAR